MPKIPKSNVPKTIGIVGSRRRDTDADFRICRTKLLEILKPNDRIVSGGCEQGGDRFADILARSIGLTMITHYPRKGDLDKKLLQSNPKAAYAKINFARNTLIAQDCDVLIALVAPDRTGGTEDTVKKAIALGKEVILV